MRAAILGVNGLLGDAFRRKFQNTHCHVRILISLIVKAYLEYSNPIR